MKERGPGQELTLSFGSSFFCNQVFFVYDPSSSTSLLSSAMGQTKAKNRNGNGGDWSETQWRCLIGGEPKNTVGLVTSTSFLDKLKLDSEGDCSFKPEISRGAEISQDFFFGG